MESQDKYMLFTFPRLELLPSQRFKTPSVEGTEDMQVPRYRNYSQHLSRSCWYSSRV